MDNNIKDKQSLNTTNELMENIPKELNNPYFKTKPNSKDSHFIRRTKNIEDKGRFRLFHQNIRGLKGKVNELLLSLLDETPHIICLTEHNLKEGEIEITHIPKYKLGAKYCRLKLKNGGVCIYIMDNLIYSNICTQKYNKEQNFEICAIQINTQENNVIILCIYRAPSGNYDNF
jgi:hypothetical protein